MVSFSFEIMIALADCHGFLNLREPAQQRECMKQFCWYCPEVPQYKHFELEKETVSLSIRLKRSTLNCCRDTWAWQETGAYIKLRKISKNDQITKLMGNMLTILWGLGQSQNSYPSTQAGFSTSPSWDLRLSSCGPCCPSVLPHRIATSPQHIWCGHGCATVARVNFKGRVCISWRQHTSSISIYFLVI